MTLRLAGLAPAGRRGFVNEDDDDDDDVGGDGGEGAGAAAAVDVAGFASSLPSSTPAIGTAAVAAAVSSGSGVRERLLPLPVLIQFRTTRMCSGSPSTWRPRRPVVGDPWGGVFLSFEGW